MLKERNILFEELSNENVKAFEEMYRMYYARLCRYAYSFIRDRDAVQDIVHDIFSFVWDNINAINTEEPIKYYLYRAVKNRSLDYLKHQKVKITATENLKLINLSPQGEVHEIYEQNELAEIIARHVNTLPEKCRNVFVLIKFQGMSYSETAKILGISPNTVENQMVKAFTKLRETLSFLIKEK